MRPSRTTGENASDIPPAPTVSMWAFSIRLRPPPLPLSKPTTLGRPGAGSTTDTSSPASRSHAATNEAIAPSPEPEETRSGFTDSIATSSQISSCRSSRSVHAKRMQTIEKKQTASAVEQRTFEPKDVLNQVLISTLAVAPDGSSVVYVRRTVEDGKYARRLWRVSFDGGAPDQLTSAVAGDGRPRYSPDGKNVVFISDRSGKPQAWLISLSGGEPRQLTDLPGGVGAVDWSPDGRRLLLLAGSGEKRFLVGSPDDPVARRIRVYTWRMDGVGYRDEFTSIWETQISGGKPRRITEPTYNVEAAAWSPDSKSIAFVADRRPEAALDEYPSLWEISSTETDANPQHIAALKGAVVNVTWAPTARIGFLGINKEKAPGWANVDLYFIDGARTQLVGAGRDLNIQNSSYGDYMDDENFGLPPLVSLDGHHV